MRFSDAVAALGDKEGHRSARTANVLGVSAGIHRWPFKAMNVAEPERCVWAEKMMNFAREPGEPGSKTARGILAKIGFKPGERVCVWDPAAEEDHPVPTMIFKGSADAVVNGCQAEYFFNKGVRGDQSVFVEIPDAGHAWMASINSEMEADLPTLVAKFLELSASQFRQDTEIKRIIQRLGVSNNDLRPNRC
jgi:pimeloyl-ACP methyl ester carboxylesterase